MLKINRTAIPNYLSEWRNWGKEYPGNYNINWRKIYISLCDDLRGLTQDNCSFCGAGDPLRESGETVEHFKPKNLYPRLSFFWWNLFLCCSNCQKNTKYHIKYKKTKQLLIKPDKEDYSFKKYFKYNTSNGFIDEKDQDSTSTNFLKANYTIKYYNLNNFGRPEARKEYFDKNIGKGKAILSEKFIKYRFLFE